MTMPTAVMTKLDAVNSMLASIGQSPINTITGTIPKDASMAVLTLDNILREVLTKGWSFNSDDEYLLNPEVSLDILIPSSAMWADPTSQAIDAVVRYEGGVAKLYNRTEQTFSWDRPVACNVIWAFEFEEIPQVARHYVAMRAGRIFQAQIVGSPTLFQYTDLHEKEAYAAFKRLEKRSKRYNLISQDPTANRQFNPSRY